MDTSNTKKIKSENFLINRKIYVFLIQLFRNILVKEGISRRRNNVNKKLSEFLEKINNKIIKKLL